jgi:serine/threonine kinase 32
LDDLVQSQYYTTLGKDNCKMGCIKSKEAVTLDPVHVTLDHFEKLRVVGKGAFGKVHAVQRRDKKVLYAMKVLDKQELISKKMVSSVLREREFLARISYPLIVNLCYAFQTETELLMIVDLMLGGALRYHLNHDKHFSEERCKFYVAQTALSLHYLHRRGLVHRDIKPDNLLLDAEGNCHITDFNLSIEVPKGGLRGTAGTRNYIAPEILNRKPYGFSIDWFSLGVLLYEMYTGRLPFSQRKDEKEFKFDPEELYLPSTTPKGLKQVLFGLLEQDPAKRLNFESLKQQEWFAGLSWEDMENKRVNPPFQPDQKHANFDGTFDLDEQFETKKKKVAVTAELDEQFKGWDYNPEVEGKKTPRPLLTTENSSDDIINAPTVAHFDTSIPGTINWPETDAEARTSESDSKKKANGQNGKVQANGDGNSQSSVSDSSSSSSESGSDEA